MFGIDLKRSVVTFAVTAGLLAVAGPASAHGGDRVGATSLKLETEVTDYVRLNAASHDNRSRTSLSKSGSWRLQNHSRIPRTVLVSRRRSSAIASRRKRHSRV